MTFDGKLCLAPLPPVISNVLDLGTGTGIWAIDFADENPNAVVTGTDLSPIQPNWVSNPFADSLSFVSDHATSESNVLVLSKELGHIREVCLVLRP